MREKLWVEFDFSDVKPLQEDEDKLSQTVDRLVRAKIFSVNEIREKYYKAPKVEWGDRPWVGIGEIQAGDQLSLTRTPTLEGGQQVEGEKTPPPESKSIIKAVDDVYNELHWFMLAKAWEAQEAKWVDTLKRLFREQEREVLGKIGQNKSIKLKDFDPALIFDEDKWITTFYKTGLPLESLVISGGIANAKRYLADALSIDPFISLESPQVQQYLASKTMKFARDVNTTTREAIRGQIDAGLLGGETIDEIAGRVKDVFDSASRYRAQLIARTETVGASNQGTLMAYKAAGIPLKKKWLTAQDERVRDSHVRAGRLAAIPLDQPFVFAGEEGEVRMNAPGDPGGERRRIAIVGVL